MSQLLWRNSSSRHATPGGLCNRVLNLANWFAGSKVKPPILQSLSRPHYSAESQYVVMYSTRCQQCGALGESQDLGSLFKRWWMPWWMERGTLMDMHGGIEGTDVSRGLSSWQYAHYVFWSQLGNDPWMDWASLQGGLARSSPQWAMRASSFLWSVTVYSHRSAWTKSQKKRDLQNAHISGGNDRGCGSLWHAEIMRCKLLRMQWVTPVVSVLEFNFKSSHSIFPFNKLWCMFLLTSKNASSSTLFSTCRVWIYTVYYSVHPWITRCKTANPL